MFTYENVYERILLEGSVRLLMPKASVTKVKTGLKNYKARLCLKQKKDGLPVPTEKLSFTELPATKEDALILEVSLVRAGSTILADLAILEEN